MDLCVTPELSPSYLARHALWCLISYQKAANVMVLSSDIINRPSLAAAFLQILFICLVTSLTEYWTIVLE